MKKLILPFTMVLSILFASNSFSQSLRNREVALIAFNFTIHQSVKQNIDEFAHHFPEVENSKANKVISLLKDKTWFLLEEKLNKGISMYTLPLNTYGRSFKYDEYGYPSNNINRALRQGTSRYYFRVDLIIDQITYHVATSSTPTTKTGKDTTAVKETQSGPLTQATITLTAYSDKGIIPIQKVSGKAYSTSPWQKSAGILTGIINDEEIKQNDTGTYLGLMNLAIDSLIENMKR